MGGFKTNMVFSTVTDVNECLEGTNNCLQECDNTAGSFKCSCFPGYEGGGNICTGKSLTFFHCLQYNVILQDTHGFCNCHKTIFKCKK